MEALSLKQNDNAPFWCWIHWFSFKVYLCLYNLWDLHV